MPLHRRARRTDVAVPAAAPASSRWSRYAAAGSTLLAGLPAIVAATVVMSSEPTTGTVRATAVADASALSPAPRHGQVALKFQVKGIPAGASVVRADLVVQASGSLPTSLEVAPTPAAAVQDAPAPAASAAPAITAMLRPRSTTASIDVTRLVRGNGLVRLSVAPRSAAPAAYTAATNAAQLQVTWRRPHGRPLPAVSDPGDGPTAIGAPVVGSVSPVETTPEPTVPPSASPSPTPTAQPATCTVSAILVPSCGVWWGAMANSGNTGVSADQALSQLETQVGRPFDIDHYYYKDDQHFPSQTLINRAHETGKHRLLLLNWKPATDHTWGEVAAGAVDARIDSEATYLKSHFTDKFFLVIWHEPENDVIPTAGSGMTAADYAAMWRHVVLRLRGDGATNAVTVICYEATPQWASEPWWPQLWPGGDVVDWMGEDAYSMGTSKVWGGGFAATINRVDHYSYPNWDGFYTWAQRIAPTKPIMIPEYGAQEITGDPGHKASFFNTEASDLHSLPAVKAVVYWNNPGQPDAIDSTPTSLAAFRQLAQDDTVNPQRQTGQRIN